MGFKEEVFQIIEDLVEDCDHNNAKAAAVLGVSAVTLWHWRQGSRGKQYETLFNALDNLNVHVYKGDGPAPQPVGAEEEKRNAELKDEVALLKGRLQELERLRDLLINQMVSNK